MKDYQYLFFDLDGTLTDPAEGITRSAAYALNHFGIIVDDLTTLYPFIGPPLKDSFKEFYNFTEEKAEAALLKYRERYREKGIFENKLYPAIPLVLEAAVKKNKTLMVATSKPTPFAIQILEHFNLSRYFTFVGGSGTDGSRPTKADVIRHVIQENRIEDLSRIVMIGDRKHDIIGAKEVGIDSIGVLYGYGDYQELSMTGADHIINVPGDLNILLKL